MPIIQGQANFNVLAAERRAELQQQLRRELSGQRVPDGPLIFETPLDRSSKLDVVVVWDEFGSLASEDLSTLLWMRTVTSSIRGHSMSCLRRCFHSSQPPKER